MSYVEIIFLAFALSVDACVVSFTYGLCFNENRLKNSLLLASSTAFFQGLMPCFGYFLTSFVKDFISPYSGLIIFTIFTFLGLKFIKEAFEDKQKPACISPACLILIGVATSIDALVSGASLRLTDTGMILSCLIIGLGSFLMSITGFWSGNKIKNLCPRCLEVSGGIILIALAVKALV